MALKTIRQKENALTNHQTYFPDYGWNFVKAGTETDTTHYSRVNPLFQVWFGLFFPLCLWSPWPKANNCTRCHNQLKFKSDRIFMWKASSHKTKKTLVFAQTWKWKIKFLKHRLQVSRNTPKAWLMLFAEFSFHALWNWGSAIRGKLRNWFHAVTFAGWEQCLSWAMLCCAASPLLLPPQQSSAKAAPGLCCERRDEWRLPSVICAALGEGSSGCTHRGAQESLPQT